MILIDFVAMILLYTVHKVLEVVGKDDEIGEALFLILMLFGGLFLLLDTIEKVKGIF